MLLLPCVSAVWFRHNVVAAKVILISLSANRSAQIYCLFPAFPVVGKLKTRNVISTIKRFFLSLPAITFRMVIHIFNPEHDIMLADGRATATAPHAARALRGDLGFLPVLWARDGDVVLVDDVPISIAARRTAERFSADVIFLSWLELACIDFSASKDIAIEPWGWDAAVVRSLVQACPSLARFVPDERQLAAIRRMSSRLFAAEEVLPKMAASDERFTGEAVCINDIDALLAAIERYGSCVVKAPWSSSGRGVRYFRSYPDAAQLAWCRKVIERQGAATVEPLYDKVVDFAMEFVMQPDGVVVYRGLSLFRTVNGAYTGSVIASEKEKESLLARYIEQSLIAKARQAVADCAATALREGGYVGPFGVDMMAVRSPERGALCVHPCVEVNLRRTMGHAAIALAGDDAAPQRLMTIAKEDRFRLHIVTTGENLLNTAAP